MADPLDGIRFAFGSVDLLPYCPELRDTMGPRFAAHQLWGRDGARQEEGANMPRKCRAKLVFAGDEWLRQISDVLGKMVRKPRDILHHPIQGSWPAVLKAPIEASFNPSQKGAVYEVDAQWEEDAYDQRITFERGPAAQAKIVDEQCSAATVAAAALQAATVTRYTVGPAAQRMRALATAAVGKTEAFTAAATGYSAAALAQFESGSWDPQLAVALKRLPDLATASIQKLRLLSGHGAYDATTAVHRALQAATDLDLALRALFPVPVVYPVPMKMSIYDLVAILYPHKQRAQRLALAEQIQKINRFARPDLLVPGDRVQVPAP